MCRRPRAISSRRFMPPENVFTWSSRRSQSSKSFSSSSVRCGAHLARDVVEHAVDLHVLLGGQFAVEAGVLEDDAEALADLVLLDRGIEAVELDAAAGGRSSVVSILMVVVLPAPLGPRKAKISPCATSKEMSLTAVKSPKTLDQIGDGNHPRRCLPCAGSALMISILNRSVMRVQRLGQNRSETVVLLPCADSGAKVSVRQTLVICASAENNPVLDDHVLPEDIRIDF